MNKMKTLKTNLLRLSILILITHILFDLQSFLPIFLANLLVASASLATLFIILFMNDKQIKEK